MGRKVEAIGWNIVTNVAGYHFETLDYRLMRLDSERLSGTAAVSKSTFMVTPHIWRKDDDEAPPRQLAVVATLKWVSGEASHTIGVAAMFAVTRLDGGDGPIHDAALAPAVDAFTSDEGSYVVYDFAQRQLRLLCAMYEQDISEFEMPAVHVVPWEDVQDQEENGD